MKRKDLSHELRLFALLFVMVTAPVLLAHISIPSVKADTSPTDPTYYDSYIGSWSGIRPEVTGYNTVYYDQKVENTTYDSCSIVGLTTHIYEMNQGIGGTAFDTVAMRTMVSANSRQGIDYAFNGPNSNSFLGEGRIDTGLIGHDTGVWLDLPFSVVFFGAAAKSGEYSRVWICSNGFLSFTDNSTSHDPAFGPSQPHAVVAPFWRDFNLTVSGSVTYTIDTTDNIAHIWWSNMASTANGNLESFRADIYCDQDFADCHNGQSTIKFVYGSITPGDGVNTAVGIETQDGRKVRGPYLTALSSNTEFDFTGSQMPSYLSSLKIIVDNGGDPYASESFDTSYSVGYHVVLAQHHDIQLGDMYGKDIMSIASFLAPTTVTIGAAIVPVGLILGGVSLTLDLCEQYLNYVDNANAVDTVNASVGQRDAHVKVFCNDGTPGGATPLDASLNVAWTWNFFDTARNRAHSLTITAIAFYSSSPFGGDIYSVATTETIGVGVGEQINAWGFEDGSMGNWYPWSANPGKGRWGNVVTQPCYEGTHVVWCDAVGGTQGPGKYDTNMDAYMEYDSPSLVGYCGFFLYFKAWLDTADGHASLSLDYYDSASGSWQTPFLASGHVSSSNPRANDSFIPAQFLSVTVCLPPTFTKLRFRFTSDSSATYQGAYLDAIDLIAIPNYSYDLTVNSYIVDPLFPSLSVNVSLDSGSSYLTPVQYNLAVGSHTIFATPFLYSSDNKWNFTFTRWDDGTNTNPRTINVPDKSSVSAYYTNQTTNKTLTISVSGSGYTNPSVGTSSFYYGTPVSVAAYANTNWTFANWNLDNVINYTNPISVTMNSNHSLTACFYYSPPPGGGGGGGGGCPYVVAWNGTGYVLDNNILPDSESNLGHDTRDYYMLEQPLVPTLQASPFSLYSLKISEFEHEHDYIDQAQLLAVDYPTGVNVAVSPTGEILTYKQPIAPMSAVSSDGFDLLSLVSASDGNYYQGYNGSYITLTFAAANVSSWGKLFIRSEDPQLKCPISVQLLNATGQWNTIASFHTRSNWTTDIINLTGCLPDPQGNLEVRLCFVSNDKIDYVGLDNTPQASIHVHYATLLNAVSSSQGDVTRLLKTDDEKYAELLPGQQILLTFMLPTNQSSQRAFIFYAEGHYVTIP